MSEGMVSGGHHVRRFRGGVAMLAAVALLAACLGEEGAETDEAGTEQGVETQRFTTPAGFALPFTATLPPGISAEPLAADRGDAVRFVAMAGDSRDERAFLHLFVAPPNAREQTARELARTAAESYRVPGDRSELSSVDAPGWAVEKYAIRSRGTLGEEIVGWVAFGRHGDRWYHILVQSPAHVEAEFGRAVERILASWTWQDDGTGLAR